MKKFWRFVVRRRHAPERNTKKSKNESCREDSICRRAVKVRQIGYLLVMTTLLARSGAASIEQVAAESRVARALEWLDHNQTWITEQQIRITEIPAPEFEEHARGKYVGKVLEACGMKVRTDSVGNVIAERPGSERRDVLLLAAHLDTVFPAGTDVRIKKNGQRLEAPGIGDNGAGLATLAGVARGIHEAKLRTQMTVVFAADVGEEGEGNLRGMKALVDHYHDRLRGVIALDGFSVSHITTVAIASRRLQVTITGPGGHSWADFGTVNPITALSRAIVRFSSVRVSSGPRTTYNFGLISGGTSVNSIPSSASVSVDFRSEDDAQLNRLETALRTAVQDAMHDEMEASKGRGKLDAAYRVIGERPGGKLPENSPLLAAVRDVDKYLGNESRLERSSTDANIPLSMGIPALSIGGGGYGGGAHTLAEWYDPSERAVGLKRALLTVIAFAGVKQ
jgi:tripeptide aminopeptidase